MKGRIQGRGAKWLRVAFVVAVAVTAHALHGGSAQAATTDAAPKPDIVFAGFTSQRLPAFFKVGSDGRVLLDAGIAIRVRCASGATAIVPDAFVRIPIANGRLQTSYTSPATIENGVTTSGTDSLKARLGPSHSELRGTWRLRVQVTVDGGPSVSCDSGPVHFAVTS